MSFRQKRHSGRPFPWFSSCVVSGTDIQGIKEIPMCWWFQSLIVWYSFEGLSCVLPISPKPPEPCWTFIHQYRDQILKRSMWATSQCLWARMKKMCMRHPLSIWWSWWWFTTVWKMCLSQRRGLGFRPPKIDENCIIGNCSCEAWYGNCSREAWYSRPWNF